MTQTEPQVTARPPGRAADASMDLLKQIVRQPVDPDYASVAARGDRSGRSGWLLGLAAVVIGALLAVSVLQTTRTAPVLAGERKELISRIQTAESNQDQLRDRTIALSSDNGRLRAAALGDSGTARSLESQINTLDPVVGTVAVKGPGLLIVVDDAANGLRDGCDRVLDMDLQILIDGLWQAGAEAISVNGHRPSALTATRGAGEAITVDYRSLTRPYRIQAIGDPRTLQARYVESGGGVWWNDLAQNRRTSYDITAVEEMTLTADAGMVLRYAKHARS